VGARAQPARVRGARLPVRDGRPQPRGGAGGAEAGDPRGERGRRAVDAQLGHDAAAGERAAGALPPPPTPTHTPAYHLPFCNTEVMLSYVVHCIMHHVSYTASCVVHCIMHHASCGVHCIMHHVSYVPHPSCITLRVQESPGKRPRDGHAQGYRRSPASSRSRSRSASPAPEQWASYQSHKYKHAQQRHGGQQQQGKAKKSNKWAPEPEAPPPVNSFEASKRQRRMGRFGDAKR
jgi:hypothetical protein